MTKMINCLILAFFLINIKGTCIRSVYQLPLVDSKCISALEALTLTCGGQVISLWMYFNSLKWHHDIGNALKHIDYFHKSRNILYVKYSIIAESPNDCLYERVFWVDSKSRFVRNTGSFSNDTVKQHSDRPTQTLTELYHQFVEGYRAINIK